MRTNGGVLGVSSGLPNLFGPFEVTFILTWQLEVPKYVSDLDIYVWQRYRRSPRSQKAYIVRLFTVNQQTQRLIIRLNSTAQMAKFREQRCHILPFDYSVHNTNDWSAADELILSIIAVCKLVVGDTSKFLEDTNEQLDYLVFFLSMPSDRHYSS